MELVNKPLDKYSQYKFILLIENYNGDRENTCLLQMLLLDRVHGVGPLLEVLR